MLVTVGAELAPTVTLTVPSAVPPAGSSARTVTVAVPAVVPGVSSSKLPFTGSTTVTLAVSDEVAV